MTGPTTPPPSYPDTPAYGDGITPRGRPGNPFQGGRPLTRPGETPTSQTSGLALAVALSLAWNLVTMLGVLVWGWPAGNLLLLFWVENAVLGLVTLVKVLTARAPTNGAITVNGRPRAGSPGLYALFFALHYGIFCLVHLGFAGFVAWRVGLEPTFWLLGFPAALLVLRYGVETATSWFGAGGQRPVTSSSQAMMQPYPRIIVLHLAVLGACALVLADLDPESRPGWVRTVTEVLPAAWRTDGVAVVVLLLVVKTVVDLLTTRRALRR